MNLLTGTVTVPLTLGAIAGLVLLLSGQIGWWAPLLCYFLFGVIVNGTIAHRYFAHNSFWVPGLVRKIFGVLVVLAAYGLPLIWILQHRHHHKHSDGPRDDHTPIKGLWHAFLGWRCSLETIKSYGTNRQIKAVLDDPIVKFTTRYYFVIIWIWISILALIDWKFLLAGYCLGIILDHVRLGLVNTVCHLPKFPGNYRNFNTKDQSQNNLIIGLLGCGFGWHNNHHHRPGKLIMTKQWWEIDIEGYIGWLIDKIFLPWKPANH